MRDLARRALWVFLAPLLLALLVQCNGTNSGQTSNQDPQWPTKVPDSVDFARDVKPLLEVQCVQCHNSKDASRHAGLNLETRQLAMTTGRHVPVIVPGKPEKSPLIQVLKYKGSHPTSMPPAPDKIWGVRLEILEKWIRDGAEWPENVHLQAPSEGV